MGFNALEKADFHALLTRIAVRAESGKELKNKLKKYD